MALGLTGRSCVYLTRTSRRSGNTRTRIAAALPPGAGAGILLCLGGIDVDMDDAAPPAIAQAQHVDHAFLSR